MDPKIVNCTPHDVTLRTDCGDVVYPKSGCVPRITFDAPEIGQLGGAPIVSRECTGISDMPPVAQNTVYIVSTMVFDACPERTDLVVPDSGPTAIRDERGQIAAVVRFVGRKTGDTNWQRAYAELRAQVDFDRAQGTYMG